ncbi:MAG: suppressor of los1-1 [Trichoglossum hirsutum]|nr:MAG: suppressor of los1-1 [Trichoglossum hirsutum]
MGGQPTLYSFSDVEALATSLRSYILSAQKAGLDRHGAFKVAVSGGSLPNTLARALLPQCSTNGDAVQWDKWEIFFADERAVPLESTDSTYKLLKDELLDKLPADGPKPKVHTIDEQHLDDIQELADQYEQALVGSFAAKDSVRLPIFDLLLLGCGPDGHTCSLFPQHPLLREVDAWVAPIFDSPKPPSERITLTLPVITHGLRIAFVATGESKKGIMRDIFDKEEGQGLPCGLVNEGGGEKVSWFTDQSAAAGVSYPRKSSL